jgi:hypothetical protein
VKRGLTVLRIKHAQVFYDPAGTTALLVEVVTTQAHRAASSLAWRAARARRG